MRSPTGAIQEETEEIKEENQLGNIFTYLEEADFQKPIWTSYSSHPQDIAYLLSYMPKSWTSLFLRRSLP